MEVRWKPRSWSTLGHKHKGGALSAVRAQCNYLGVEPYWRPILCDTRDIIVAPSVGFDASSTMGIWHFWIFTHFHPFPPLFTLFFAHLHHGLPHFGVGP